MIKLCKIILSALIMIIVVQVFAEAMDTSEYIFCDNQQCVWCYETVNGVRQHTDYQYFSKHP